MRTPLGQNFLTDKTIAERIVESAGLSKKDNVLEIGPGKGILTEYLAEKAGRILAIEIDSKLANALERQYAQVNDRSLMRKDERTKCSKIIHDNILNINLPKLIEENDFDNYRVVANLPYYITSKIIRLLLETKYPPQEMVLMVQKEVGERIVALDAKESILSISVKFYAEPEILFYVPREKFLPVPEVDSVVIKIKRKKQTPNVDTKRFFSLVRAGFSSKRKTLLNNMSANFPVTKAELSDILKKAGIEPTIRAERLKVEDWVKLCSELKTKI